MPKIIFLKENIQILLETRENTLNSFKSNVFPIENAMPDPTPNPILNPLNPPFYTLKQDTLK